VSLSPQELVRYNRHLTLPEFGEEGQRRLKAGRVLIVGAGGLGSPAALYLAAAGVGTIGLVDFDRVDETNLQRQILYSTLDVGRPKLGVAADRLRAINPDVELVLHDEPFAAENGLRLVEPFNVVIDGTDNFATRYLVNDACVLTGTPNVYGSVFRFEGQAAVFAADGGPCYRCLHPEPPPPGLIANCAEAGVLGVLPGIIGTVQATEAIKLITGIGEPLVGRLLLYDALRMRVREIALPRDPACPVCGETPSIRELVAYDQECAGPGAPVGRAQSAAKQSMTVEELRRWRREGKPHLLLDVREPSEHAVNRIDGALLIPLRQLPTKLGTIPRDQPVVVHCKSGGRSAIAVAILKVAGYDAHNLSGGIQAWESESDRS
jgi:sulfur-carrier protein adenylyltransferase/sulfurtransferase